MQMKEWCALKQRERLQELIDYFGDVATLARFLQMSFDTVYAWKQRGKVSTAGARKIHQATGGKFAADYLLPTAQAWFLEHNRPTHGND